MLLVSVLSSLDVDNVCLSPVSLPKRNVYTAHVSRVICTSVSPGAKSNGYDRLEGKCDKVLSLCYLLLDRNEVAVY